MRLLILAAAIGSIALAGLLPGGGLQTPAASNQASGPGDEARPAFLWEVHDMNRPQPPVVDPGPGGPIAMVAPSDAVVLFGPTRPELSAWRGGDGPAAWKVLDAAMIVEPGSGDIWTKDAFGDVQLHIEWMVPADRELKGQQGGNSGVFFLDRYELQILSSNGNTTYPDGMAGSIYGQFPPLVNACRPAGQWNTYDAVFRGPVFGPDGALITPAVVTVFLNGVLVQDQTELLGATAHQVRAKYTPHEATAPIRLQDHGDPIRFRNVWVRNLPPRVPAQ